MTRGMGSSMRGGEVSTTILKSNLKKKAGAYFPLQTDWGVVTWAEALEQSFVNFAILSTFIFLFFLTYMYIYSKII